MKKRILALLSVLFLVCFIGGVASASSVTKSGKTVSSVTPTNTTQTLSYSFDFSSSSDLGANPEYSSYEDYGVVIPVKITSAGCLTTKLTTTWTSQSAIHDAELYTDAACTNLYKNNYTYIDQGVYDDYTTSSDHVEIAKAGTYYLKIYTSASTYYDEYFKNTGSISLRFVSSANRTLSANKTVKAYGTSSGIYYKVTVTKAGYLTFYAGQSDGFSLKTTLCNSSKKAVSNSAGYLSKSEGYKATYKVSKGTYYVKVTGCSGYEYKFKYAFSTGYSLAASKWLTLAPANSSQNMYVKVKATKTGYITLSGSDEYGYVTLCNSKQKAISDKVYLSSSSSYYKKAVFAVKKNQVYYLKINSSDLFKFKYTITGVTDKSGASSKKALSIKKGKTGAGLIIPENKTNDYYKITLSKAQVVTLTVKGNVSTGGIKVEIYSNKSCKSKYYVGGTTLSYVGDQVKLTSKGFSTNNKLSKGTYYIKVSRKNAKSNGSYSIKWNK